MDDLNLLSGFYNNTYNDDTLIKMTGLDFSRQGIYLWQYKLLVLSRIFFYEFQLHYQYSSLKVYVNQSLTYRFVTINYVTYFSEQKPSTILYPINNLRYTCMPGIYYRYPNWLYTYV